MRDYMIQKVKRLLLAKTCVGIKDGLVRKEASCYKTEKHRRLVTVVI